MCTATAVDIDRRASLFRGSLLAIALHGAGAWPLMRHGTLRRWTAGIASMFWQMLLITPSQDQHWTSAQVCSAVGLPPPEVFPLHGESGSVP